MHGLTVNRIMSLSGHPLIINKIAFLAGHSNFLVSDSKLHNLAYILSYYYSNIIFDACYLLAYYDKMVILRVNVCNFVSSVHIFIYKTQPLIINQALFSSKRRYFTIPQRGLNFFEVALSFTLSFKQMFTIIVKLKKLVKLQGLVKNILCKQGNCKIELFVILIHEL